MTWALIVLFSVGLAPGVAITTVPGFKSQQSCERAARETEDRSKHLAAWCIKVD